MARKHRSHSKVAATSASTARRVALRYVTDEQSGIKRRRRGKGFQYSGLRGQPIRDSKVLRRIRDLVIPPAWTDVWICPFSNGHLQATGRDSRGRKQYLYHSKWADVRDEAKFGRMALFGALLPRIRRRVSQDLKLPGLPKEKVLATVVRLLEKTLIRIGNEEYARANRSFGLTTLRNRHAAVRGQQVRFRFRGKGGKQRDIQITDPRIAGTIRRCQDLPGQELFQYLDEDDNLHSIDSADVNNYLRGITGEDITAKDFRTWGGTRLAARLLCANGSGRTQTLAKRAVRDAIHGVAERLGNTVAICRKSYIHPVILTGYLDNTLLKSPFGRSVRATRGARGREEQHLVKLLKSATNGEAISGVK